MLASLIQVLVVSDRDCRFGDPLSLLYGYPFQNPNKIQAAKLL
jgi:hypothetical protein